MRSRLLLLTLVFGVTLGACGDDDTNAESEVSRDCEPVGTELAASADQTVAVDLTEYAFGPAELSVRPGVVTFEARNDGEERHELAFLPGGQDVPFTDGAPDEGALAAAGAFELEGFSPSQTCSATYDLEPGTYTLFCIVEADDGQTHYEKGMRGTLTVA